MGKFVLGRTAMGRLLPVTSDGQARALLCLRLPDPGGHSRIGHWDHGYRYPE